MVTLDLTLKASSRSFEDIYYKLMEVHPVHVEWFVAKYVDLNEPLQKWQERILHLVFNITSNSLTSEMTSSSSQFEETNGIRIWMTTSWEAFTI
ncbi:hypothetical protein TSAR_008095 [Trichomalopsis sarcophagae]|uniref:Uncharacterized protein n=1 Tax=Trichomalopsis sarcophagae TaxID=543379 RepID=A0A232FNI2_9HYME|nr:hypothetical protein TSAR_008095 [Trichomalopsis sarcophagae]